MNIRSSTRTRRRSCTTAFAVVAALAVLASPAGAADDDDPGNPTEPTARADLKVTALTVTPVNNTWSISYTVANTGSKAAPRTTAGFNGGAGLTATRSVSSLAAGASTSGTFQLPRTQECSVRLYATADSGGVVPESSEYNNTRSAVGAAPTCPAKYRITAYSFTANDESGPDWPFSDEPFWTFDSISEAGTAYGTKTPSFDGIDTGETRYFGNLCLFGCSGVGGVAPSGIGSSIQLWEEDWGNVDQIYYDIATEFGKIGPVLGTAGAPAWVEQAVPIMARGIEYVLSWADNDLLGKLDFTYDRQYLDAALPWPGTSFNDTRVFTNGDATYTLVLTVQRTG